MIWRRIPPHPRYEASDDGEIRCSLTGIVLKPRILGKEGNRRRSVLLLKDDGVYAWAFVGRMVCWAFHGDPPTPSHQAAHENGICLDDRQSNLNWKTPKQNSDDKRRHGTMPEGERGGKAILSRSEARMIRIEYRAMKARSRALGHGKLPNGSVAKLAARFGVGRAAILSIGRGRSWRCLDN